MRDHPVLSTRAESIGFLREISEVSVWTRRRELVNRSRTFLTQRNVNPHLAPAVWSFR